MEFLLPILIFTGMAYVCYKKIQKQILKRPFRRNRTLPENKPINRYSDFYQRKLLFTKNEYWELQKLNAFTKANGMEILAKVRLLDLVEPRAPYTRNRRLLNKVWAKHVDFVVTDKKYHVIAIIELDDNTHNRPDRIQRDIFVNDVLRGTGYNVIRTFSITKEVLQAIKHMADKDNPNVSRGHCRAEASSARPGSFTAAEKSRTEKAYKDATNTTGNQDGEYRDESQEQDEHRQE